MRSLPKRPPRRARLLHVSTVYVCGTSDGLVREGDVGDAFVNGYEASKKIRQQIWGKEIVIVALTGWGQEEDRRRTKLAGFDGHYVKPLELEKLRSLLSSSSVPRLGADST